MSSAIFKLNLRATQNFPKFALKSSASQTNMSQNRNVASMISQGPRQSGRLLRKAQQHASRGTVRQLSIHVHKSRNLNHTIRVLSVHSQPARFQSTENLPTLEPFIAKPFSYAYGRSNRHLQYKTVGQLLEDRVAEGDKRKIIISHHENIQKTFAEFNQDVNRLAKSMYDDLGLRRGDVAGLWSCNTYNWIVIQYACAKLGVILCTINPFYQTLELDYVLRKGDVKVLFLPGKQSKQEIVNKFPKILSDALNVDDETCHEPLLLKHIVSVDGEGYQKSDIPSKRQVGLHELKTLMERNAEIEHSITCQVQPDDPAIIMFTSGTTGKPKGAYLSHFTIANNASLASTQFGVPDKMTVCVPLPFFHSFAGVLGNVSVAAAGFQLVIPCLKYNVEQMVEAMLEHKVTHVLATPTLTIDMLNYIRKNNINLDTLHGLLSGGASMPVEITHKFVEKVPTCVDFRIGYGATELGPCSTACRSTDTFEERTETVGTPLDFVEIKVINPETKRIVKLGETGEIHSRGHNTMLGYWKEPEKTRDCIDHAGWYNTGDLGTMDEKGFLKIVGRTKEMIIVGGENVYPREIEELLHTHPAVSDAHVIGVPDPRKGEEVCAWIMLHPDVNVTEDEMRKFCQERITYFKVPRYFLFVDGFPITSTGKAQKFKMREITCKKFNLKENK